MMRNDRRQVMLGSLAIFSAGIIGLVSAFTGLMGASAQEGVWKLWADLNAVADSWYAWTDKLGKLVGFLVTIFSGAYAIHQRYHFAEFNMHIRLREFQQRVEERLRDSNKEIDRAATRPSPSRPFEYPIFTDESLNPVLRRMKWGRRPKADETLEATLDELQKQIGSWDIQKREYELRIAHASLLKGAIAAARAATKTGGDARKDNVEALGYFQEAFRHSRSTDPEALEYIGHQQVRLGDHHLALETFRQLAAMAGGDTPSLLHARGLKYQAEIFEFRSQPNLFSANATLIAAIAALPADADLLEKAEVHETHGRVREKARIGLATQSYTEAERLYQRIADDQASDEVDRATADAGLNRVREALQKIRLRPMPPTIPNGGNDASPG